MKELFDLVIASFFFQMLDGFLDLTHNFKLSNQTVITDMKFENEVKVNWFVFKLEILTCTSANCTAQMHREKIITV